MSWKKVLHTIFILFVTVVLCLCISWWHVFRWRFGFCLAGCVSSVRVRWICFPGLLFLEKHIGYMEVHKTQLLTEGYYRFLLMLYSGKKTRNFFMSSKKQITINFVPVERRWCPINWRVEIYELRTLPQL